jgi:hypothetical protein
MNAKTDFEEYTKAAVKTAIMEKSIIFFIKYVFCCETRRSGSGITAE